jgi:hypothetical protein
MIMKHLFFGILFTIFSMQAFAKHHHEAPSNNESLAEAWGIEDQDEKDHHL